MDLLFLPAASSRLSDHPAEQPDAMRSFRLHLSRSNPSVLQSMIAAVSDRIAGRLQERDFAHAGKVSIPERRSGGVSSD